jgi:transglycosylase-like protein with SLT domain
MTDSTDDTAFWDPPDWVNETPRPRRAPGRRTRTHHVVTRDEPLPPLERTGEVDVWLEPHEPARRARRRAVGVDPRLLRLGAASAAIVLMVPVALALRGEDAGGVRSSSPELGVATTLTQTGPLDPTTTVATSTPTTGQPSVTTAAPSTSGGGAEPSGDEILAVSDAPADPACAGEYTVVAGDYWLRFVESSGADLDAWLAANGASTDTPLYAGDELCIPAGASAPAAPPSTTEAPTTRPPATAAPAPTEPPTTDPPTTDPPTTEPPTTDPPTTEPPTTDPPTTEPPTTPAPPTTVAAPVDPAGVEAMIRDVWPDEIEDRALVIAQRESSLQPGAYNGWCCYGLFQIYFEANRAFLSSLGVTTAEQLFDARTNIRVAYAMYQRSGWGPWASTDPG